MRLFDRLQGGSPKVTTPEVTRHTTLVPFEVVGKTESGVKIREIVWAKGWWGARTSVAEMYRLGNRLCLHAYELLRDGRGGIAYAANGNPIWTFD